MSDSPFQKFIELVSFDQKLNALEHDLSKLQAQEKAERHEVAVLAGELEQYKHTRDTQKKQVDLTELEMKSLQAKQTDLEKKLNAISHHKEYQSISSEIENLKKKQYEFEDNLLMVWNEYENAQRLYDARKKEIESKIEELQHHLKELDQQATQLKNTIDLVGQERQPKVAALPAEWMDRYSLMRKTVINPVVPVKNGSCSACFYPLIAQDMIGLQKRQLLQCKSCFRFLYLKEAHENA